MKHKHNFRPTHLDIAFVVSCFLISIWSVAGCTSSPENSESRNGAKPTSPVLPSKKVRVHKVSTKDIVDKRTYAADLEASTEVTLYPLMAERIVSFPVEEGDRVRAGQVIARIRAASIKKSIAQMQAEIESLDQTLRNQSRELERSTGLYNTFVITQQSLEQIESSYKATLAKRKSMEASLGQVEVSAGNALLRSPVDGFVIEKKQEEGDTAQPGLPLCSIVGIDPIRVELGITEKDLAAIRKGMSVELTVGAVPERIFKGSIVRILPVLDTATRTNKARIEISNPVDEERGEPLLKPGMFGRVSIIVDSKAEQIVVPARALMVGEEASFNMRKVFVIDNKNIAHERTARIGVRNDAWYEVVSGLRAGERVVLRGQYGLRDKDKVEVLGELRLNDRGEAVE